MSKQTGRKRGRGQRAQEGAVYALQLQNGEYAYAQVCKGLDFAFFDFKSTEPAPLGEIVSKPVAFRVFVAKDEPVLADWTLVGVAPLAGALSAEAKYKHQPVGSESVFVYSGGDSRLASAEEAQDHEVLAVWFSAQIEQRLIDHFAGRPNLFVEQLRKGPGHPVS